MLQILHPAGRFGRVQAGEEFGDGSVPAGEVEVGIEFGQGGEHKAALMGPRMGEDEGRGVAGLEAEGDQVEVERAGFVQGLFRLAAEVPFEGLEASQQTFRGLRRERGEDGDRVEEDRGVRGTIDRAGAPEGGTKDGPAREGLEAGKGTGKGGEGIAEVGPERHDGVVGEVDAGQRLRGGDGGHWRPSTSCME